MRLRIIRKQRTTTKVDQHQADSCVTRDAAVKVPSVKAGYRTMIERIKNVRKDLMNTQKSTLRQLTLNAQSLDGSSSSSMLEFIDWIH